MAIFVAYIKFEDGQEMTVSCGDYLEISKSNLIQMVWLTESSKVKLEESFKVSVYIFNLGDIPLALIYNKDSLKLDDSKSNKGQILNQMDLIQCINIGPQERYLFSLNLKATKRGTVAFKSISFEDISSKKTLVFQSSFMIFVN